MSNFFVMLVFKTVIRPGVLLVPIAIGIKDFASLELEHFESNNDFMDGR